MAAVGPLKFLLVIFLVAGAIADDGDDFSNNLFTDLTPLLSLFGERVTMEFMSQSLGWADNFMLAMAPLGIITIIISAIRVGGPPWLKNIIGRGRENLAIAEAEIMSSTSNEVCELYNGNEVVRCMGTAPVSEFICLLPQAPRQSSASVAEVRVISLDQAKRERLLKMEQDDCLDNDNSDCSTAEKANRPVPPVVYTIVRNDGSPAPNISLNSHDKSDRRELHAGAVIGSMIQLGVLIYAGFATYYPTLRFYKDDSPVADYAFPCTTIGTVILIAGMLLCAHVVDFSTKETRYRAWNEQKTRLVWLQQTKTVNDQQFTSHAVWTPKDKHFITVSGRKDPKEILTLNLKTVAGTLISVCGYVIQFIGLRGMHWSASMTQLGAVLVMTCIRAFVRRGLAQSPKAQSLESNFELDWFALTFQCHHLTSKNWPPKSKAPGKWFIQSPAWHEQELAVQINTDSSWMMEQAPGTSNRYSDVANNSHRMMKLRRDLGYVSNWPGLASQEAVSVARAIEITMDALVNDRTCILKGTKLTWSLEVRGGEVVKFRLERQEGKWKAFSDEIDAALSLWLFSVHMQETEHEKVSREQREKVHLSSEDDAWLRAKESPAEPSLRILGLYTPGLHRDLWWWMREGTARVAVMDRGEDRRFHTGVKEHRILGHCTKSLRDHLSESGDGHVQQSCWLEKPTFSQCGEYGIKEETAQDNAKPPQHQGQRQEVLLTTRSYANLKQVYAQEIFSAFMWNVAKTMTVPLQGTTHFRPDETSGEDTWHDFTLYNDSLSRLILDVESSGLGSLQDAYMLIIPPLSEHNRLLTADSIFEFVRQNAKGHESRGDWEGTCEVYSWLFQTANTFPTGSDILTKATALLVECLRQITLAAESMKVLDERTDHMLQQKSYVENELRSADHSTLQALIMLYEAQRRPWKHDLDLFSCQDESIPLSSRMRAHLSAYNFTGLHEAILMDFSRVVPELEKANAENAHGRDIQDWTPLHYAAAGTHGWLVKKLLDRNAHVNARDMLGWTPLHYACLNQGDENRDDATDEAGNSTEDSEASIESTSEYLSGTKPVQILLRRGADLNAQGRDGLAPLHCASMNGHRNTMRTLIQAGAFIDVADNLGRTPLFLAAQRGHGHIVMDLWAISKMQRDEHGRAASHFAASSGNAEIVEWLVDEDRKNARIEDRRRRTPLHYAALNGHVESLKPLIQGGAEVEARDEDCQTPLHLAAIRGQLNVMKALKDLSADPSFIDTSGDAGRTALHHAAENGDIEAVKWLVENGAEPDAVDCDHMTALHLAVYCSHKAVVEFLLSWGARFDIQDVGGQAALQLAEQIGNDAVVEYFRRKVATMVNTT